MTIRHKCEGCGSTLKIKDELAGKPGKCPKCKAKFIVGQPSEGPSDDEVLPSSGSSGEIPTSAPAPAAQPDDEEDDIFGKDFFKISEPVERPRFTMPAMDQEEHVIPDEDAPAKPPKGGPKAAPAPAISSADSAAAVASQLLAKSGKKNKTPEMEAKEAKAKEKSEKVDYTEAKYMLTHKVLPYGGGALVLVALLYWGFTSMLSDKSTLPPLGTVTGVVNVQGKPAPLAEVRFEPQAPKPGDPIIGSFSVGWTDANGVYQLQYDPEHQGAAVGKHRVIVTVNGSAHMHEAEVKPGKNDIPLNF